ncbi:hypothetical protein N7533_008737 [Penicillium manginii]|uniref:uncharacterized protein n=1 Tax=Penicillium manginii TaxID=203109 RepID=UPI002546EF47|nr:uncharacterized protein N7533_008737 [Penicillium manginii]KAJ5743867.1 hypothetical protein N7533_008737 [Penicillium manginii]
MKLFALIAMLGFLTNGTVALAEAIADPNPIPEAIPEAESETTVLEPRVCVRIRVCHDFNFKGSCYSQCKGPGTAHSIRKEWQTNAGSFAVDTDGYSCTLGTM